MDNEEDIDLSGCLATGVSGFHSDGYADPDDGLCQHCGLLRADAGVQAPALEGADKPVPRIGSFIKIKDDADGSGAMAQGLIARVTAHTTGSYGHVKQVYAELVLGPTEAMNRAGIKDLDLYPEEYDAVTPDAAMVEELAAKLRDTLPSASKPEPSLPFVFYNEEEPPTLFTLVEAEKYKLVIDEKPQAREDALGCTSWERMASAQLCKDNVVAITENLTNAAYCVSHEIAHGKVGFDNEKEVLIEQADILARWVHKLLDHIHGKNT